MDAGKRRLELLKLEGLGLTQVEIVAQLSEKAQCTKRTVYNDFESRAEWQPLLQTVVKPQDVLLKFVNRYEQVHRQASIHMVCARCHVALPDLWK